VKQSPVRVDLEQYPARRHRMRFGAEVTPDGTWFRLWAPGHPHINLIVNGRSPAPMLAMEDGWHELHVEGLGVGSRYTFMLPNGEVIPDPASRFQPDDIDGESVVVDASQFVWQQSFQGRPWNEAVIYELHIGSFTPDGTWAAAATKLDHLVDLGVTVVQIMPVAEFFGDFNWGYDGSFWFAPAARYGEPDDFRRFVDAAHRYGLMVTLDVVLNHFGAEGNHWVKIAPIFTDKHENLWGEAVNFDDDGSKIVRRLVIDAALHWLTEYDLDGLRLDSAHMMLDDSQPHILEELAASLRSLRGERHTHLVIENSDNGERWLARAPDGEPLHYHAQWNDDLHHVLHCLVTGENTGYFADFDPESGRADMLGRAFAEGFVYQGDYKQWEKMRRGEPSRGLPPAAFVHFMQSHDQIGNRLKGDRIATLAPPEAIRAWIGLYLLSPQIPMLFMGEEWAASTPFPFFSSTREDKRRTVECGRREELKATPEHDDPDKPAVSAALDPTDPATFALAKLDWAEIETGEHRDWLEFYRSLIALRKAEIVPRIPHIGGFSASYEMNGPRAATIRWQLDDGSRLVLRTNLGKAERVLGEDAGRTIWSIGTIETGLYGPWSVSWSLVA
jgi:maltooligosyltrehalose trehalohydrolase